MAELLSPYGGAGKLMYELAYELVKQGLDVTIFSFENAIANHLTVHQVFPGRKFMGPISTAYFSCRTLKKLLSTSYFDVVHGTLVPPTGISISVLNRVFGTRFRLLLTSHGMAFRESQYCEIHTLNDLALRYAVWPGYGFLDALSTKGACHIVANSEETKKDLKQLWGIEEHKLSVIPPGIFVRKFLPQQNRSKTKSTRALFNGIFVGRLVSRKRVHLLLRVAKGLESMLKDFQISVVGDGHLKHDLVEQIHALRLEKRVILLGNIPEADLISLLHSSDVFLFPSAYEGFGMVVLEALASGLPVVTSRIPAARFVKEGCAGYVVNWNEPEKIVKMVSELYYDPNLRRRLSDNALKVSKEFDWSHIASEYVKLYDMLGSQ